MQRLTLAEQNAQLCAASCAHHDGGGGGEPHGAGTGDDQNGDGLDQRFAQTCFGRQRQPGEEGDERDGDDGGHEISRHAIHQGLDGQFGALSLLHHGDDLAEHRIRASPAGADDKGAFGVHRPADHRITLGFMNRDRFAGQHGFVHIGLAAFHFAIHGQTFAGAHMDKIAGRHLIQGQLDSRSVPIHASGLRAQADQLPDRSAGAALGARLHVPACKDQRRDHRGGFEIDMARIDREQLRRQQDKRGIGPRGASAQCDERVHFGRPAQQRLAAKREEPTPGEGEHQRGQHELDRPAQGLSQRGHDEMMEAGDHVPAHLQHEDRQRQQNG